MFHCVNRCLLSLVCQTTMFFDFILCIRCIEYPVCLGSNSVVIFVGSVLGCA